MQVGEPGALFFEGLECLSSLFGDGDLSVEVAVADEWAEEDEVRIGEPEALPLEGVERLSSLFGNGDLSFGVTVRRRPADEIAGRPGEFVWVLGFEALLAEGQWYSGLCESNQGQVERNEEEQRGWEMCVTVEGESRLTTS